MVKRGSPVSVLSPIHCDNEIQSHILTGIFMHTHTHCASR